MAQEDLDNMVVAKDFPAATAAEGLEGYGESIVDVESAAAKEAAGVSHIAYVDYAEALEAYADRNDIEDLASKGFRNGVVAADFSDADFVRQTGYGTGSSGI